MAEEQAAEVLETQDGLQQETAETSATAEAAKAGEAEDSQATANQTEQEKEKAKRPGGWVRKLTKAEQERDYWRDVALGRATQAKEQAKPAEESDPEPKQEAFSTYEDYVKALGRWTARQEFKTLSTKQQEEKAKAEAADREHEVAESYRERLEAFAEDHDDYNLVVSKIKVNQSVSAGVTAAIMEDENGPAMAYYLGQNPDVVEHINSLSMAGAVKYLGRLAERLFPEKADSEDDEQKETAETESAEPAPKPKIAAQAPAPIKPVKKSAPTATGLADDLPMDQWMKRREAQLRK